MGTSKKHENVSHNMDSETAYKGGPYNIQMGCIGDALSNKYG